MLLYKLRFPNGKRYLGITYSMPIRWQGHCRAARYVKTPLYNAFRKYGADSITYRVLAMGDRDYIVALEIAAIAKFNTRDPRIGYNVALGGQLSPMLSPVVRAKQLAYFATPASKARRSAATRLALQDPSAVQKRRDTLMRPDVRAKRRLARAEANNRPEVILNQSMAAKRTQNLPHIREAHRIATTRYWRSLHNFRRLQTEVTAIGTEMDTL